MARLYIVPSTGTGVTQVVPLDPADYYGPNEDVAVQVTTRLVNDDTRPDVPHELVGKSYPVTGRGPQNGWLVVDFEMVGPPPFTPVYDLGDPQSEANMTRVLTNPEANAAATMFGVSNQTFRGMTIRQVAQWCAINEASFAAFVRGLGEIVLW